MKKTTCREVKTRIQSHIVERLGPVWDEATQTDRDDAPTAEKLGAVVDEFGRYYNPYEQRRNPNRQSAFTDFLRGLPMCLNVEFEYYTIRKTLAEWLEETPKESEKYTDEKSAALYMNLIYREFSALCRKNKIDF